MTLICEGFLVYLVEVNCPVLLWLVSSTTWLAFLSWTFICQADWSLFHVSVSGWMILHSSQSIFLQILLPFSKFLLLQLVLFSCLTLTSQFSSFLSILCSPSLAAYKYFCHLAVIHTSKQHWDVLMFQRSESLLWGSLPEVASWLCHSPGLWLWAAYLTTPCCFSVSVKWGW